MQLLDLFRRYYNHTIHPELLRLESKRKRLLLLLFLSTFLIAAVIVLEFILDILVLTLFMLVPIGFYITYLIYRIQRFKVTFKPKIVNLINDFLDDAPNIQNLDYDPKGIIPKERFIASQIFATDAPYYFGEDLFTGKIGELQFEMCELHVREYSRVRARLNYVFRGVFLHSTFKEPLKGAILILPSEFRQYLSRTIRLFTGQGGRKVEFMHNESFEDMFMTYATPNAKIKDLLSEQMQHLLVNYRLKTNKEIYLSFIGSEIYIAVTEPKNLLEPFIFSSNVNFETIREFFEDIHLLIDFVEKFDQTH